MYTYNGIVKKKRQNTQDNVIITIIHIFYIIYNITHLHRLHQLAAANRCEIIQVLQLRHHILRQLLYRVICNIIFNL